MRILLIIGIGLIAAAIALSLFLSQEEPTASTDSIPPAASAPVEATPQQPTVTAPNVEDLAEGLIEETPSTEPNELKEPNDTPDPAPLPQPEPTTEAVTSLTENEPKSINTSPAVSQPEESPATNYDPRIDPQASSAAPWQIGQTTAQGVRNIKENEEIRIERRFLGITHDGHYLVQDFYQNTDTKRTDPFVTTNRHTVTQIAENYNAERFNGELITWYPNGQKSVQAEMQNDKKHGHAIWWYENGQKWQEADFDNDQFHGLYTSWDNHGKKTGEECYRHDTMVSLEECQ